MSFSFNPLAKLFETTKRPHARTLRSSFLHKLYDAYCFFAGSIPFLDDKQHLGLFDYITLLIPTLFWQGLEWSVKQPTTNTANYFLLIPLLLINIPLFVTRILFGVIATILTSPITALVHACSLYIGKEDRKAALEIKDKYSSNTLQQLLDKRGLNLEELTISINKVEKSPSSKDRRVKEETSPVSDESNSLHEESYLLSDSTNTIKETNTSFYLQFYTYLPNTYGNYLLNNGLSDNDPPDFEVEIVKGDNGIIMQGKNIHALFKHNIGNINRNIEKHSSRREEILTLIYL